MSKLITDKVKKLPASELSDNRYDFLRLSEAEPDFGVPSINNGLMSSLTDGTRNFLYLSDGFLVTGNNITSDVTTTTIDTSTFSHSSSNTLFSTLSDLDDAISSAVSGSLSAVSTDASISGSGTSGSPLSVVDDGHNHTNYLLNNANTTATGVVTFENNVEFVSPNGNNTITIRMLDSDTLTFNGQSGQLFSISDDLTGTIFSVNDITGIPIIEADADATVRLNELAGNVLIGTATDDGTNKLQVNGSVSISETLTVADISVSANVSVSGDMTVLGDLTVSGTTTYIDTVTLNIGDNIVTLNADETGAPTQDAGLEIERGTANNVSLVWDETNDRWTVATETFEAGAYNVAGYGPVINSAGEWVGDPDSVRGYTGSQGPIGYTGSQGATGFTGSQGNIGYTGSQGPIGYTGSQGIQGPIGYTGSQGDQGPIGYTGSQGDIGYTGSQGIQGDTGFTGSQGIQGPIGYTGSRGPIGYTGSQGDIGYTGSQGDIGYTGSQGPIGYTGSKGDIGYTGSQGPIGYTGSQGPIGYTGSKGDIGYTGSQGPVAGTDGQVVYNNGGIAGGANLYYDDVNDRVGVKTSSPSYDLDVSGSTNISGDLIVGGDLTVSGNTTVVNTTNLEVNDAVITLNTGQVTPSNDIGLIFQRYATANTSNYNVGFAWDEATDRLIFGSTPEDGNDNDISFGTEWMTITGSGRVGIGTSTPAYKLHLYEAAANPQIRIQNAATGSLDITPTSISSSNYLSVGATGSYAMLSSATSNVYLRATGSHLIQDNSGNEWMTVKNTGNVGIGATNPTTKLDVAGNIDLKNSTTSTKIDIYNTYTDASNYERVAITADGITQQNAGTGTIRDFVIQGGGNTKAVKLFSTGNGKVILETGGNQPIEILPDNSSLNITRKTAPGATLTTIASMSATNAGSFNFRTKADTSTNYTNRFTSGGSYTKRFEIGADTQAGGQYGTDVFLYSGIPGSNTLRAGNIYVYANESGGTGAAGNLILQHNGSATLSGNVGVGTTTPSAKLDVAGDIEVNSLYILNGETATLATVTQTEIASFAAATYASGKFVIQAKDSVTGEVHLSELLVVHDGTTASATEYGVIHTGSNPLATYDVDINSGNVRILATAASTNSTTYKVSETLITA